MRRTTVRLPSAALTLATTRSSICHESTGTTLISFPKTEDPILLAVNFSPGFDTTPRQLPFCCGACFAAAVFGTFCTADACCARAAGCVAQEQQQRDDSPSHASSPRNGRTRPFLIENQAGSSIGPRLYDYRQVLQIGISQCRLTE